MKHHRFGAGPLRAALALLAGAGALFAPHAARAQTYQNIVNQRFRTISSGPQSASIVDVNDLTDQSAVHRAVLARHEADMQARTPVIERELDVLARRGIIRRGVPFPITNVVIVRSKGRLPQYGNDTPRTRDVPVTNNLTFNYVTTGENAYTLAQAAQVKAIVDTLYPKLKAYLGPSLWSGQVTVQNKAPYQGKVGAIADALLEVGQNANGSPNVIIDFPSGGLLASQYVGMAQALAQAWHGPLRIAYDAWEQGMGRAFATIAVSDLKNTILNGTDPSYVRQLLGYFYTPYYDLLNQPSLGNNTFFPPTKTNQSLSLGGTLQFGGMLVPRLQMSGTAWLKCYIENTNFFKAFHNAYYDAFQLDRTVANDAGRLRALAKTAIGAGQVGSQPSVEAEPFDSWFERQYIFDTSVTVGPKLYAYSAPTLPGTSGTISTPGGAAVFLVYYQTAASGDETDLNATANATYWNFDFSSRLTLNGAEDSFPVTNGFASTAPFFNGIGDNPRMRLTMDYTVNKEYVRIPFPANGETLDNGNESAFSGVLIGNGSTANTGRLTTTFAGGSGSFDVPVVQGAFQVGENNNAIPNNLSRAVFAYRKQGDNPVTATYQRNVAFNLTFGIAHVFVFVAPGPTDRLTHSFPAGAQMLSIPARPVNSNLATVLGLTPATALLAQYRQDNAGNDKYSRYPTLPLYQPGYALWGSFPAALAVDITGERTDIQQNISVALQFGWNQIGTPYNTNLNVLNELQVQSSDGTVRGLSSAIADGIIATGIIGYTPGFPYYDVTVGGTTLPGGVPVNTLEPWKGYWLRVLASEGVTLTYTNPNHPETRATKRTRALTGNITQDGWRLGLVLRDDNGNSAGATLGQASKGADTFVPSLDVASPPAFTRAAVPSVRFLHSDWDTAMGSTGGEFLSDVRKLGTRATWNVTVNAPLPEHNYTLAFANNATLPRGVRLTLVDKSNGVNRVLSNGASYTFRTSRDVTPRIFQIVAEPRSGSGLRISNVRVLLAPGTRGVGSSAAIGYDLSGPATVSISIRGGTRTVRRLGGTSRAVGEGTNESVWDLRDDQGRVLPSGPYTVEILAVGENGEMTRSIQPINVLRQ